MTIEEFAGLLAEALPFVNDTNIINEEIHINSQYVKAVFPWKDTEEFIEERGIHDALKYSALMLAEEWIVAVLKKQTIKET